MCIRDRTIRQRYQGVKNEAGVWITPAFPKLIYVLEDDNIHPGDPSYYLTELAEMCIRDRDEGASQLIETPHGGLVFLLHEGLLEPAAKALVGRQIARHQEEMCIRDRQKAAHHQPAQP